MTSSFLLVVAIVPISLWCICFACCMACYCHTDSDRRDQNPRGNSHGNRSQNNCVTRGANRAMTATTIDDVMLPGSEMGEMTREDCSTANQNC
mmetsp:Transcript_2337/g.2913  ORF Transcript_2337/g.2913 Transcript_2337/m.2913 type:complete len:93 (+) Transcript_2337:265-543(+)